ncbi:MAG: hypothetical protein WDN08_22110 [Rhizomicrobium sp.]
MFPFVVRPRRPYVQNDARGVTTTFTYYAGGNGASLMASAVRPADGFGNGAASYGFTYSAAGLPLTATDPDGVATANSYDGAGNLTAAALDPAHLNLVTQFAYDDAGDVTAATDPRGNVTTSLYDLDRRKIEDDRHNGNAAAAVIAAAQTVYDVLGRVVDEEAGTRVLRHGGDRLADHGAHHLYAHLQGRDRHRRRQPHRHHDLRRARPYRRGRRSDRSQRCTTPTTRPASSSSNTAPGAIRCRSPMPRTATRRTARKLRCSTPSAPATHDLRL